MGEVTVSPRARHVVGGVTCEHDASADHIAMDIAAAATTGSNNSGSADSTLKVTSTAISKMKKQLSDETVTMDDDLTSEKSRLLEEGEMKGKDVGAMMADSSPSKGAVQKTSYVAPQTVIFWLSMWFIQNIGVTFWNKRALNTIRLPVTVSVASFLQPVFAHTCVLIRCCFLPSSSRSCT